MTGIKLAIVDHQFLHGELGLKWCSHTQSELVTIINDELSKDKLQQGLLDMQLMDSIVVRYYSMKEALSKLAKIDNMSKNSLVLFKTIDDLYTFFKEGKHFKKIMISSQSHKSGRKTFHHGISLSKENVEQLKWMHDQGAKIRFQSDFEDEGITLNEILASS